MKKVLSFVLVLAMILGSVSMAFAKAPAAPFEDAPTSKLATILRDMNVLEGDNGKVLLESTISRKEVCAILMRVLGYESYCTADYAIKAESAFSDVKPGSWYNGYVNLAAQLGYVDGIGGGLFNPSGEVKLADGVAFVMKALGYEEAHLPLKWPDNFLVKAQELGLIDDSFGASGDKLTREQMFTIIYNAMDEPIVKWTISTVGLVKGDDSLGQYVDVTDAKNTFAKKAAGKALEGKYTTISAVIDEDNCTFANGFDASEYMGKVVEVLVVSPTAVLTSGTSDAALAVLGELSAKLTGKFLGTSTFAGVAISAGALEVGTASAVYFYNGTQLAPLATCNAISRPNATTSDPSFAGNYTFDAEVKLNKKGQIAQIYSLSVWEKSQVKMADATDAALFQSGNYASSKAFFANTLMTSGTALHPYYPVVVEGAVDDLTKIEEDDVVEVYADLAGHITKVVVARDVVEGKISSYNTIKDLYTISGKQYSLAYPTVAGFGAQVDAFVDSSIASAKVSNHAFYLDSEGNIFYAYNLEGVVAPAVVYSFGIVTTRSSVMEKTGVEKDGLWTFSDATNASISIAPLGTSAAAKISYVSYKAVSMAATGYIDDDGDWDDTLTNGAIVAYILGSKGELVDLKVVADYDNGIYGTTNSAVSKSGLYLYTPGGSEATVTALGLNNGKLFADDVEIYAVGYATKGATIVMKKVAEVKNTTCGQVAYNLNKAGKIDKLFLFGTVGSIVPAVVETTITVAALVDYNVTAYPTATLLVEGVAKDYVVTGTAVGEFHDNTTSLFAVTLNALGEINDVVEFAGDYVLATCAGCTYVDGVLTISDAAVKSDDLSTEIADKQFSFVAPVAYVYNATTYVYEVATDIAAALKDAKAGVQFKAFDLNGDSYYDFIVIK